MTEDRRREDTHISAIEGQVHDLAERMVRIETQIANLGELVKEFVTNSRFTPVQMLVYGLVSLIMTSVFAAIIDRKSTRLNSSHRL